MYSLVSLAVVLAALTSGVRSTSQFSEPPAAGPANNYRDNPIYHVGEDIDMQWTSDLANMDLTLWQQYPTASATDQFFVQLMQNTRSTSFIWTANFNGFSTKVADGEDAIFFLALYTHGASAFDTSSHYFNVTIPKTTTSSTATATKTVDHGEPTHDPTATATETSTGTSSPDKNSGSGSKSSGLSTGAVAGIAVASTIVGLAALGGLGFLLWKRSRKTPGDASGHYNPTSQAPPPAEAYYNNQPTPQSQFSTHYPSQSPPVGGYYKPEGVPGQQAEATELPGGGWTHGHPSTNVQGTGEVYEAP